MTFAISRRGLLAGAGALAAAPAFATSPPADPMQDVLDYVGGQKTTGFLVVRDRKTLAEKNGPAPAGAPLFRAFTYKTTAEGALLEDVASQQKSFVAVLIAIAVDKGLLDGDTPVSDIIGGGWSKALAADERAIRVIHLLEMNSGLNEQFEPAAEAGTVFFYNTPAYAVTKRVLEAAAKQPLETITQDWLTRPVGITNTAWRQRPAALAGVGNPTGLVTSPRDAATFGQIVLDGGRAKDGTRIVSEAGLKAMFAPTKTNPAYGCLWWLNGSAYSIVPVAGRLDRALIPPRPPTSSPRSASWTASSTSCRA